MHGSRYCRPGAAVQRCGRSPIQVPRCSQPQRNRNATAPAPATATAEVDAAGWCSGAAGAGAAAGDDPTLAGRCCWGGLHRGTRCSKSKLRRALAQAGCANRNLDVGTSIRTPLGRPLPLSPVCAAALRKRVALRILPSLSTTPRACLPGASCLCLTLTLP